MNQKHFFLLSQKKKKNWVGRRRWAIPRHDKKQSDVRRNSRKRHREAKSTTIDRLLADLSAIRNGLGDEITVILPHAIFYGPLKV